MAAKAGGMNAREVSAALSADVEAVVRYLLPGGKKQGNEWRAGSVNGEAGQSLGVRLTGAKAGVWADFSGADKGDLLSLWQMARGVSFAEAYREACAWLGVEAVRFEGRQQRVFSRPRVDVSVAVAPAENGYFARRGISAKTVADYRLAVHGREIMFPQYVGGEIFNVKYLIPRRTPEDKNTWRQEADCEPCLFGWQAVSDNADRVVITEGEVDALSVHEAGFAALSMPSGAKNLQWIEYEFERLQRFREIVLCLDNDEAGRSAVPELIARLGFERCRVADYGLWKDANEVLVNEGVENLSGIIRAAKSIDPAELRNAREFAGEVWHELCGEEHAKIGQKLPFAAMGGLRFRPDELTVWTGYSGHGKSQLLGFILCDLMINHGQRVCIFSGEMRPPRLLSRMVRQVTGREYPDKETAYGAMKHIAGDNDWQTGGLWVFDVNGMAKIDRLLDVFAYAKRRYGCTHFVIDSLLMLGVAETDTDKQVWMLNRLRDFKAQNAVHVHLVAHARKPAGGDDAKPPTKYDVRGSVGITDLCDNVLVVWRNKGKFGGDIPDFSQEDAQLICVKQRNDDFEPQVKLYYNRSACQYSETDAATLNMLTGEIVYGVREETARHPVPTTPPVKYHIDAEREYAAL